MAQTYGSRFTFIVVGVVARFLSLNDANALTNVEQSEFATKPDAVTFLQNQTEHCCTAISLSDSVHNVSLIGIRRKLKDTYGLRHLELFEMDIVITSASSSLCLIFNTSDAEITIRLKLFGDVSAGNIFVDGMPYTIDQNNAIIFSGTAVLKSVDEMLPVSYEYETGQIRFYFERGALSGIINSPRETYTIEHVSVLETSNSRLYVLFKESDVECQTAKCVSHSPSFLRNSSQFQSTLNKNARTKRSMRNGMSCGLHLVADHTFFKYTGRSDVLHTVLELYYYVQETDNIFRSTDFDGDEIGDNIGFHIITTKIYTNSNVPSYLLGDNVVDVYNYLDSFAQYSFGDSCMGLAFTHRDFANGVVGLAWIGNSNIYGPVGGICQSRVFESSGKRLRSYNTALVTTLNYGMTLSKFKTSLTLAHELGHSFGSHHDDYKCNPDEQMGSYLMFSLASDGNKPNNYKFSQCSIERMFPVILNKGLCFKESEGPTCGNGLVEKGEECDCGHSDMCDITDPCCTPPGSNMADQPCTIRRSVGKVCSPRRSPCCTANCSYVRSSDEQVCRYQTECTNHALCAGESSECPNSSTKPNGTICSSGRQSCENGVCFKSVCESYALRECECLAQQQYCNVCCNSSYSCEPINSLVSVLSEQDTLFKLPGSSCNRQRGYCNGDGRCVESTGYDRLTEIFGYEHAEEIESWLRNYWFFIVIAFVCIVVAVVVFILTHRRTDDSHTQAYRCGRLARLLDDSDGLQKSLTLNYRKLDKAIDNKMAKEQRDLEFRDFSEAVARLHYFFPAAPRDVVVKVVENSLNEDTAVKLLLMRGFAMQKLDAKFASQNEEETINLSS